MIPVGVVILTAFDFSQIYAVASFSSLVFLNAATYVDLFRDWYASTLFLLVLLLLLLFAVSL